MISKISASTIYSTLGNNSSLIPLGIKDVANSCGLTTASYLAGDKLEGKDRFIDEFGTQAIWLGGIPTYKYLINKTLFKFAKLDPEVDPRILNNKRILTLAKQLAPSEKIAKNIEKAAKNKVHFKNLAMAKFILSTGLTAISYFALTKFRHNYTENQIKKAYLEKHGNLNDYKGANIPFSSAFDSVHNNNNKKVSFTGGIQNFMFDPVKNLMIVDGVITSERLSHSRNAQDFTGYAIKEGSFWLFMYGAGKMISDALEKHAEKKHNKSIDLDARVIENEEFKEAFKNGSIKEHLKAFKAADKSDSAIYKFAVANNTDNLIVKMAKKSDVLPLLKLSKFKTSEDIVDTRKYIELGNSKADDFSGLRGIAKKIEKLLAQYESSEQNADDFFTAVRKLKRGSVLKNIGACIGALGVIAPAIMLALRTFGGNSEYQVKKDVEAKLNENA